MLAAAPQITTMNSGFRSLFDTETPGDASGLGCGDELKAHQFGNKTYDLESLLRAGSTASSAESIQTTLTRQGSHQGAFRRIVPQHWPKPPIIEIPQTQLLDSSLVRYSSGRLRDRTGDGQTSRAASQKLPETVTAGGNAEEPARMQSAHSSALPNPLSSRSMVSQEGAEDAPSRKRDEPAGGSSPVRSGAEKRDMRSTECAMEAISLGADEEEEEEDKDKPEETEEDRQRKRRASNRESARRTRQRKLMEVQSLQQQILQLTQANIALVKKAETLTAHNQALMQRVPSLGDRCKKAMAANVQLKEMVNSMRAAILNGGGLAGPQVAFQMQRAESAPAELAQNNLEALLSSAFRMTRPEAASRSRNNPFLASIEQPETPAQLSEPAAVRNAIARHLGLTGGITGLTPPTRSPSLGTGVTQGLVQGNSSSPFSASNALLAGHLGSWGTGAGSQGGAPVMGELSSQLLEMLQTSVSRSGSIPMGTRPAGVISPNSSHLLSD